MSLSVIYMYILSSLTLHDISDKMRIILVKKDNSSLVARGFHFLDSKFALNFSDTITIRLYRRQSIG